MDKTKFVSWAIWIVALIIIVLLVGGKVGRMGLNVMSMVQQGAIDSSECILCGECIEECPKDVIKYTFKK